MLISPSASTRARRISKGVRLLREFLPDLIFENAQLLSSNHITQIIRYSAYGDGLSISRYIDNYNFTSSCMLRPCIQRSEQSYAVANAKSSIRANIAPYIGKENGGSG